MSTSSALSDHDLREYHDFAVRLAIRAGAMLCTSARHRADDGYHSFTTGDVADESFRLDVQNKDSEVDVVTETDVRVEQYILGEIAKAFPRHKVLAEETYAAGGSKRYDLTEEPTWIVDPLDGTVNYVHLFPLICVSIGLTINKRAVVGAIYAPLLGGFDPRCSRGTLWSACHGQGAYQCFPDMGGADELHRCPLTFLQANAPETSQSRNRAAQPILDQGPRPLRLPLAPLRQLAKQAPSGLLVASEWGKDRRDSPQGNLMRKANTFLNLACAVGGREGRGVHVQGLRSLGSAALDLAYCASGAVDVFWEGGCWEWDVCAGLAILAESGGLCTDANAPEGDSPLWRSDTALPEASAGARRFLCVRPCGSSEDGESAREAQERVARAIWKAVHLNGLDYERQGVEYSGVLDKD